MIKFTIHARERIVERGIKISDIKQTILYPDYKKHTFENKILVRKSFSKEIWEVIYMQNGNNILIITAYFL